MVVAKPVKAPPVSSRFWFPGSRYVPERDLFVRRVHGATVLAPPEGPFVLQGPATDVEANKLRHTPASFRRMLDASLAGRQGVVYSRGTCQDLKVNATGAPDGFVHVVTGHAYVRGTQATPQGMYHLFNDATLDINVLGANPAHATLDRIDLVVARIQDSFYSGATDTATIEMVTGTPAGSPTVPAVPANALILAQLSIIHASATIPQSVITDRRVPAGNGIIVLDDILVGADARYLAATPQIDFLNTSGVGTNLIPPGLSSLEVIFEGRESGAVATDNLNLRLNNDSAANYYTERQLWGGAATQVPAEVLAATAAAIGIVQGTSAVDGAIAGAVRALLPNSGGAIFKKQILTELVYGDSLATGHITMGKHKTLWNSTAPITRVSLLGSTGNIIVGSRAILLAHIGIQP